MVVKFSCSVYQLLLLQGHGATELTLEGVAGVGSEMDRIHIAEKNKAMAEKLKVLYIHVRVCT